MLPAISSAALGPSMLLLPRITQNRSSSFEASFRPDSNYFAGLLIFNAMPINR